MSTWYDEDVGSHNRPTAWDGAIENDCPRCKSEAGTRCVNPVTGRPAHAPCVVRCRKSVNA